MTQHFGLRGRQEHHPLMLEDLKVHTGDDGEHYYILSEKRTKTRQGGLRDNVHSHLCHAKRPMAVRGGGGLSNGRFPWTNWHFCSEVKKIVVNCRNKM